MKDGSEVPGRNEPLRGRSLEKHGLGQLGDRGVVGQSGGVREPLVDDGDGGPVAADSADLETLVEKVKEKIPHGR